MGIMEFGQAHKAQLGPRSKTCFLFAIYSSFRSRVREEESSNFKFSKFEKTTAPNTRN